MFTQLDDSLERTRGGLGIGLSLVKQLVVQHGGSIEARSEGRGSGSEFTVRLPRDEHVDDEPVESVKDQKGARRPRRILIVDDNADVALSLSLMLELSESVTETASDGLSALKLGERFRPDLILLDLGMPHIDGFETARRIRARPWGANVLLVALTGWSRDEDIRRTREVGFDRHLIKPVDRETLEALIAEIR
jgi:CheY-like chemotaxis protein